MSWKFNPPPGWPSQPEGWQPPPGWTPDPSWPPAPPGWQFWVPAESTPPPATGGSAGAPTGDAPTGAPSAGDQPTQTPPAAASGEHWSPDTPSTGSPGSGTSDLHDEPTVAAGIPPAGAGSGPAPAAPPPPFAATSGGSFGSASGGGFGSGSGGNFGGAPTSGPGGSGGDPSAAASGPAGAPGGPGGPGGWPAPAAPANSSPVFHRWWVFAVAAVVLLLVGCVIGTGVGALTAPAGEPPPPEPGPTSSPDQPDPQPTDGPDQPPASGSGELSPGQERTGNGPALVSLNLPSDSQHMITVTFQGDGRFDARLVDASGDTVTSLAIEYGDFTSSPYTATRLVELSVFGSGEATAVEVSQADGDWSLLLQDIQEAPLWPDVTSGTGAGVLRIDPDAFDGEPIPVEAVYDEGSYEWDDNFIVWAYTPEEFGSILLFNEIGDYSGTSERELTPDAFVMEIQAYWDAEWTLEPGD